MRHEKAALVLVIARELAASAEGLTLDEIAGLARVNRRTAERLRDALRNLFPAMEEVTDGPRKRFRIPGGLDGFMQAPTADELAELRAAATALSGQGGDARAALLRSLAAKVEAAVRAPLRRRLAPDIEALALAEGHAMQPGPRPWVDADLLALLRDTLKGGAACRFRYAAAGGSARVVTVSPWGLLYGRAYYLVGPARGTPEPVLWRLDRISDAQPARGAVRPSPGWSLAAYAARAFGVFQERPIRVVLRFPRHAAAEARRFHFHPTQTFEAEPDGSLLVRFTAGGRREMAWHLFTWGEDVEIVSPASLRSFLVRELATACDHHEGRSA
ncbi:helix-turn-helix transcriptional regulator [Roseomonas chloroacetimidivorans]|uniref:helix-turn-helix transcriptional regulator n=1 Tax=Roseomonas chloroacetimidivorans TaxID=1766656 RepID=UPI003C71E9C0